MVHQNSPLCVTQWTIFACTEEFRAIARLLILRFAPWRSLRLCLARLRCTDKARYKHGRLFLRTTVVQRFALLLILRFAPWRSLRLRLARLRCTDKARYKHGRLFLRTTVVQRFALLLILVRAVPSLVAFGAEPRRQVFAARLLISIFNKRLPISFYPFARLRCTDKPQHKHGRLFLRAPRSTSVITS